MNQKINVIGTEVTLFSKQNEDYLSLTDIARHKNSEAPRDIIKNWLRNRSTIDFIGLWEIIHNPNFKQVEFDLFKHEAGSNTFVLSPGKWVDTTNAIGINSKSGRYGGTYAHQDIAFEFASWVSAEFKLYLIQEFKRLKSAEYDQRNLEWSVSRTLSKVNYEIHTDAIKSALIPKLMPKSALKKFVYSDEADLLNLALFGVTAKEWRSSNKGKKGNIRDHATLEQLVVLSNLESFNSVLIKQGVDTEQRFIQLNKIAVEQMKVLLSSKSLKQLK
jgi:KilA-N domain